MSFLKKILGTNKQEKTPNSQKANTGKKEPSSSKCPYCFVELEKRPKRKTKCPDCGEYIYVNRGKLITESQKAVIQFAYKFESMGVNVGDFEIHKRELENEWGHSPSDKDVFWRILNALIAKQKDLNNLITVYEEMGKIAEEEGKDSAPYYQQAKKIQARIYSKQLKEFKETDGYVIGVQISAIDDNYTCAYCKELNGKKYRLAQSIKEQPLPGLCSSAKCRCVYIAIFEGEEF